MRSSRRRLDPTEAEVWGDVLAAAAARREQEARLNRPRPLRRAWRWAWHRRVHAVPVVAIATLLAAAVTIRNLPIDPFTVSGAGIAVLAGWWHWRARYARRPVLVMLRPALAVLYLVLSAVMG